MFTCIKVFFYNKMCLYSENSCDTRSLWWAEDIFILELRSWQWVGIERNHLQKNIVYTRTGVINWPLVSIKCKHLVQFWIALLTQLIKFEMNQNLKKNKYQKRLLWVTKRTYVVERLCLTKYCESHVTRLEYILLKFRDSWLK